MQNMYQPAAKGKGNSTTTAPREYLVRRLMVRYQMSRALAESYAQFIWVPKRAGVNS